MFTAGIIAACIIEAQARQQIVFADEARLRSLPADQRDFELRLREVKALEAQARRQPIINVRSSIF